jgi:outer membrane immunogenic protein
MKHFKLALTSVLAITLLATPSNAGGSIKDEVSGPFAWTGFYIGGQAGLANGETSGSVEAFGPLIASLTSNTYNMTGGSYGGFAGYNYQVGHTVYGVEADFAKTSVSGSSACIVLLSCRRDMDSTMSIVGRIGVVTGQSMLYAKAGMAWAELQTTVGLAGINLLSGSSSHSGPVVGFGIEHAVSNRLMVRFDYSHMEFGNKTQQLNLDPNIGVLTVPLDVDAKFDVLKIGASYKLN